MRLKSPSDLILVDVLSILLIIVIIFIPSGPLRIILGLPFLLFFPGYVLIAALYPRMSSIDGFERVALSLGLSITMTSLIGLVLNYTPWGISLYSVIVSLLVFIVVMSLFALFKRRRIPGAERYNINLTFSLSTWKEQYLANKVLSIVLAVVVLGAIITLGYAIISPKAGESYTEFYILGMEGQTADYPGLLQVGQEGRVMVGIVNREHEITHYRLEIQIGEVVGEVLGQVDLGPDEQWEDTISFTPQKAGDSQKIALLLYNLNKSDNKIYRQVHFWADVTGE